MSKPKVIKDYEKLPEDVVEQIKLVYPRGFRSHLITFTNLDGQLRKGLPFETEDRYYLIRMSEEKAMRLVSDDDDYDDNGILKASAKKDYEDKHEDEDFLNELNSNDDNDLGFDELPDDVGMDDDDLD